MIYVKVGAPSYRVQYRHEWV